MLARYRFGRLSRWAPGLAERLVGYGLRREARGIQSIEALQHRLEPYLDRLIERSTHAVTYSGLEHLRKDQPHLFLANHRDIVMDPAFVNYALYHAGHPTPRIAIGDNLLQRPFVSDLMRLNKSFIVHRSITGRREKLASYQSLSAYINHSIHTGHSVWIAQSEGRAKDGKDETDSAIIKMFCMSRRSEPFPDVIRSLNIVPVSIAYEWDPCDLMKARELEQLPATIEALEARVAELTAAMSHPDFFRQQADAVSAHNAALAEAQGELDQAYARWEALESASNG